jgi:hypothetical protein
VLLLLLHARGERLVHLDLRGGGRERGARLRRANAARGGSAELGLDLARTMLVVRERVRERARGVVERELGRKPRMYGLSAGVPSIAVQPEPALSLVPPHACRMRERKKRTTRALCAGRTS